MEPQCYDTLQNETTLNTGHGSGRVRFAYSFCTIYLQPERPPVQKSSLEDSTGVSFSFLFIAIYIQALFFLPFYACKSHHFFWASPSYIFTSVFVFFPLWLCNSRKTR